MNIVNKLQESKQDQRLPCLLLRDQIACRRVVSRWAQVLRVDRPHGRALEREAVLVEAVAADDLGLLRPLLELHLANAPNRAAQ
eukprot:3626130-Prymnesium_polylepis.1